MKECVCEEKVQYAYASNPGLPLRNPEQPRAGRFFIGWSIFLIGFQDFTCACTRFSGFCRFIVLACQIFPYRKACNQVKTCVHKVKEMKVMGT